MRQRCVFKRYDNGFLPVGRGSTNNAGERASRDEPSTAWRRLSATFRQIQSPCLDGLWDSIFSRQPYCFVRLKVPVVSAARWLTLLTAIDSLSRQRRSY